MTPTSYYTGGQEVLQALGITKVANLADYLQSVLRREAVAPVAGLEGRPDSGFVPRNQAEDDQLVRQLNRPKPNRPALEVFRENVQKHYGKRAPNYAQRLLQIADDYAAMQPNKAGKLRSVSVDESAESSYAPRDRRIELSGASRPVALHEFGHHMDRKKVKKLLRNRSMFNPPDPKKLLKAERTATRHANTHLGGTSSELSSGYATYLGDRPRSGVSPLRRGIFDLAEDRLAKIAPKWLRPDLAEHLKDYESRLRAAQSRFRRVNVRRANRRIPTPLNPGVPVEFISRGRFTPPEPGITGMLNRMSDSLDAREDRLFNLRSVLTNPVISPAAIAEEKRDKLFKPQKQRKLTKKIDKAFGAGAGDQAYAARAAELERNLREEHPLVGRLRRPFGLPNTVTGVSDIQTPAQPPVAPMSLGSRIMGAAKRLVSKVPQFFRRVR